MERAFLGEHVLDGEPRGALDEARHLDGLGRPAVVVPARPWDGPVVADVVSTAAAPAWPWFLLLLGEEGDWE